MSVFIKGRRTLATNALELHKMESPMLDAWEIPASHVIIEKRLGEGCFGEVFKGSIPGPISNPSLEPTLKNKPYQTVAVKLLKGQLHVHIS